MTKYALISFLPKLVLGFPKTLTIPHHYIYAPQNMCFKHCLCGGHMNNYFMDILYEFV